ncbi:tRNA1(Val) (adenine(37)-N6)-methyltransferase [Alkalibacter rhizosphaerae]|uniref:tRNA1(Val) (Adenine(37)-N6)-methyltransferase n=1 Tax=Alkalibacter rhizosphaerae TaxID=2815577 RepID=A0A974XD20_9FIRM|nr:tRNA1(Val) (adenine(37)-N6)-methyltransferase [Alkalibacter rhizosphaerae]QSX07602.1 tRNA1(Val) (adenine(37)-N6)-methyltransferase [Alkalibacter rhizosphaerae]
MEKVPVFQQERVDNLHICGLKLIQGENSFRYGVDAVLLSWMAGQKTRKGGKVADLGTGSGIIPILLAAQYQAMAYGLELVPQMADMAQRSVRLNGLEDRIRILEGDIKDLPREMEPNTFDVVVSNPPYMSPKEGLKNESLERAIARHEIHCNIQDVTAAAKRLLKTKGRFFLVHRPHRMVDVFCAMRNNGLEPKRLILVKPARGKAANMMLVEGLKEGNPGLIVEEDLYVYGEDGNYSDQILEIYQKKKGALL